MTEKEKAESIYNSMYMICVEYTEEIQCSLQAKKCAIRCVDEQINNAGYIWGGRNEENGETARDGYRKYWNEVKDELLKL